VNCSPTFNYLIPLVLAVSLLAGCTSSQVEPAGTNTSIPTTPTSTVGINESARDFELYFDDELVGSINCMVNHCEVDFTIPLEALPGNHTISIEGGSNLDFLVSGD
jgi:hypothetical protein